MQLLNQILQRRKDNDCVMSLYQLVDKACHTCHINARHQNIPISAKVLKRKALYFAKVFSYEEFQASDGWLDK